MLGALAAMAIQVVTKDCTALSDSDLAEMADLCESVGNGVEFGVLSKQAEAWVLVTLAHREDALCGFSFCTLERIGGTPSVLIGLASVERTAEAPEILGHLNRDQLRRAVLAFPDEDVLIGTRMVHANAFEMYAELNDIVPRPGHKASGEERAWGRRLAKRFGIESANYDDRAFLARGDGALPGLLDYRSGLACDPQVELFFSQLRTGEGDVLIAFGWAMAEYLDSLLRGMAA
jgi:hypothetical protein